MNYEICAMARFLMMLMDCHTTFRVRWCPGEEVPCWSVELEGEDEFKGNVTSFCFNADGSIQSVFVG